MRLEAFLSEKPLYYKEIDYNRFPRIWERYKTHFSLPKVIHVIGTNGKGSTGRFLAHYLKKEGLSVGHYSSPHILRFNERIWKNGADIDDETLEAHHRKLMTMLSKEDAEAMSYFEYTTLLAVSILEDCEYIVMEAGLGGEYDATAVFEKDLTIVTPIGMDHESFLGKSIEQIAKTKLNAIRKFAILGKQEKAVYKITKEYAAKKRIEFFRYTYFFTKEEMARARRTVRNIGLPPFFVDNLLLALAGAKFFGHAIKWKEMEDVKLLGRMQKVLPNVTVDVGHNPMAAKALADYFRKKRIVLVYNSYADKEYPKILEIFKPIVKRVEILPIYNQRVEDQNRLEATLAKLGIAYREFEAISQEDEYLVFGSFAVVEEFLKHYVSKEKRNLSTF
jgi:dihydrofolate synthase/folylpolyglutamate synthase